MGAVQPLVTLVRSQNRITQFELKHLPLPHNTFIKHSFRV